VVERDAVKPTSRFHSNPYRDKLPDKSVEAPRCDPGSSSRG
jgi:hypothetical protein